MLVLMLSINFSELPYLTPYVYLLAMAREPSTGFSESNGNVLHFLLPVAEETSCF